MIACYSKGKEAEELSIVLGEAALSDIDKLYLKFSNEFEKRYVSQGDYEDRDIEATLNLGWQLLSMFPKAELKRIRDEFLEKYYGKV